MFEPMEIYVHIFTLRHINEKREERYTKHEKQNKIIKMYKKRKILKFSYKHGKIYTKKLYN